MFFVFILCLLQAFMISLFVFEILQIERMRQLRYTLITHVLSFGERVREVRLVIPSLFR